MNCLFFYLFTFNLLQPLIDLLQPAVPDCPPNLNGTTQPPPNPHLNGEVGEILWIRLGASRRPGGSLVKAQKPRQKLADWKVTLLSFFGNPYFQGVTCCCFRKGKGGKIGSLFRFSVSTSTLSLGGTSQEGRNLVVFKLFNLSLTTHMTWVAAVVALLEHI